MTRHVVLLRGINVGRHKRIKMGDLRALLAGAGYDAVRTHGQSGNVVLTAGAEPDDVARRTATLIAEHFGFPVDIVVRTAEALEEALAANPLGAVAEDPAKHLVVFLSEEPDPAGVQALEEEDFAPDVFAVRGRDVHLWCPDGVQDSRAAKVLTGTRLAPVATARNWSTVTKLAETARAG